MVRSAYRCKEESREKAEGGKIPGDGMRRLYSSGLIVRTPSALNKDG